MYWFNFLEGRERFMSEVFYNITFLFIPGRLDFLENFYCRNHIDVFKYPTPVLNSIKTFCGAC